MGISHHSVSDCGGTPSTRSRRLQHESKISLQGVDFNDVMLISAIDIALGLVAPLQHIPSSPREAGFRLFRGVADDKVKSWRANFDS